MTSPAPREVEEVRRLHDADRGSFDYLVYLLSTMTVDVSLPGEAGPRWSHLSLDACKVLVGAVRLWLPAHSDEEADRG